ncbi:MAG TPA: SDR family oxidoreductase [Candidatus Paceibacterota bacterium]|nr:SDR family oxidoreductase [Candidatus Paceibacterota bacterium]
MSVNDFEGLRAIVTGGASGIGAATAKMLQSRGAKVTVLDRQEPEHPIEGIAYLACDIQSRADVNRSVEESAAIMGGIDIVVNNAGIGATGDVAAGDDEEWRRVLDINVVGTARVSAAALPFLRKSQHAALVNVSSVVAVAGFPQRAIYAASKGAVYALTLAMAADHVKDGIRINCVVPGTADTPWVARLLKNADDPIASEKSLRARQPMGRLVKPEEIAFAICYLASPLAGSTTGIALNVDGGISGLRLPPPG